MNLLLDKDIQKHVLLLRILRKNISFEHLAQYISKVDNVIVYVGEENNNTSCEKSRRYKLLYPALGAYVRGYVT